MGKEKSSAVGGGCIVLLAHVESNGSCSTETYVDPT